MISIFESSPLILILTSILTGLIMAFAVQTVVSQWSLKKRKRKAREYLALRVAVLLEDFSRQCLEKIHARDINDMTDDQPVPGLRDLPELDEFPEPGSWHLLDGDLANRILTFRNTVKTAGLRLQGAFIEDQLGVNDLFVEECGICGADAFELARSLRVRHGLKTYKPPYDYPAMLAHRALTARVNSELGDNEHAQVIELGSSKLRSAELPVLPIGKSQDEAGKRRALG